MADTEQPRIENPEYVGAKDAAKILGVHPETMRRVLRSGKLKTAYKTLTNDWRVDKNELVEFLKRYR